MRRLFESLIKQEVAPNEASEEMAEHCVEVGKTLLDMVKRVYKFSIYSNVENARIV